jgi:hypothetical protein
MAWRTSGPGQARGLVAPPLQPELPEAALIRSEDPMVSAEAVAALTRRGDA